MKHTKGYVYCYNRMLKQAYFVAKFESIGDATLYCSLINHELQMNYSGDGVPVNTYICNSKKLEKSPYGDYFIYEE